MTALERGEIDRRSDIRTSVTPPQAVILGLGGRSLRGLLWDVTPGGAKVLFEHEDYRSARASLAEALRSGRLLQVAIGGEGRRPLGAFLVWYGVAARGGFAVGLEIAPADALRLPEPAGPAPHLQLVGVHHRESRQARLALSLRDLFLAIGVGDFSLDSALHLLCEKVCALVGAEGVTFWALDRGEPTLRAQAGRWTLELGSRLPQGGEVVIPPFAVLKEAVRKRQQLFANDATTSVFAMHPGVQALGLRSIMIVPVFGREVDFGMLVFGHSRDSFAFGAQEQTEAEIFANQAALFFEKAQLLEDYRSSASFLAAMNRIALAFHERLDVDRVLDVICRETRELFRVDLATVFLRENGGYAQRAAAGMKVTAQRIDGWELPAAETSRVELGEAFYVNDFEAHPLAPLEIVRRYMGSRPAKSVMVIPIRVGRELLGTLTLADRSNPNRFTAHDLDMAKLLGQQAAQALLNARLYERVAQSRRIIQQQDRFRILGELAGVVSHEIKNALVPLRTLVDLLPQRYDDADFREWYARTIAQEVERMHSLVTQLSRFRSAGRGTPEPTDPAALVKSVVDLVNPEARSRQITLQVEAESLPPVSIVANELRQVLLNLILNAIQAVEEKGTVKVGVCRPPNGGGTMFWVSDDGPGIEADKLDRIFDPLFTTKENGSGLGLAIARDLVQGNSGTIAVESESGKGATFTVTLPGEAAQPARPSVVH
ncbi:MAG: GAF domain-containing protein [Candidatus Binatia bacterium]